MCLTGTVVASWSLTQEVGSLNPLDVMTVNITMRFTMVWTVLVKYFQSQTDFADTGLDWYMVYGQLLEFTDHMVQKD